MCTLRDIPGRLQGPRRCWLPLQGLVTASWLPSKKNRVESHSLGIFVLCDIAISHCERYQQKLGSPQKAPSLRNPQAGQVWLVVGRAVARSGIEMLSTGNAAEGHKYVLTCCPLIQLAVHVRRCLQHLIWTSILAAPSGTRLEKACRFPCRRMPPVVPPSWCMA